MMATLQDLRDTLSEAADQSVAPDGHDVLASVERAVVRGRRRAAAGLAAVAVTVVGLAGALALGEGRREAADPSGPPTTGSLRVVTDDPLFAEFDRGYRRLAVVDLPLGTAGTVDLSGLGHPDRRLYAWRYCTGTRGNPVSLRLVSGRQVKYVGCADRDQVTSEAPQVLWLPTEAGQETVVSAPVEEASARDGAPRGTARIAFYESSPWEEFRFPTRPADLATNPAYAWDPQPADVAMVGPADPKDPNAPRSVTVPYQERLGAQVLVRGPGSVRMGLNGRGMNLYCESSPMAACPSNEASIGDTFTTWAYGITAAAVWFDNEPDMVVGKPVTVTIDPSHFTGDDWRVVLTIR